MSMRGLGTKPLFWVTTLVLAVAVVAFWQTTAPAGAQTGPGPGPGADSVPDLGIVSKYYIVVDAETGEVFAQRGAHEQVAPASLTKIFTSIAAIEAAPPDYEIVTTEADLVGWDATQVGFGPAETFTLEDLLYGMMLPSGNDAARAVARALGAEAGDSAEQAADRFMARLNGRLRDMGLTETTLINPDGWGVPGHRSSAHDIAAFTMYALEYPRFVQAISSETYEMSSGGYELVNTNKRLGVDDDLVGGKTGYDDTAGYCLMQVARRGDDTMIAVTLDGVAPDVWYDDNRALLDYAFEQKVARRDGPITGGAEMVRYLDPDAAVISRIAQASASIGAAPDPALVPFAGEVRPVADSPPQAAETAATAQSPAEVLALPRPAASANGLGFALLIAAVLGGTSALRVRRTLSVGEPKGRRAN